MSFDAYDTNTSTGDSIATVSQVTKDRTDALAIHHLAGSAPALIANGWIWIDNTSGTRYLVKLRQNGSDIILGDKIAEGNRDLDGNEYLNFRVEQLATGSLTAAGAAVEGQLEWDTTVKKLTGIGDSTNHYMAECATDASQNIRVPMRMYVGSVGTPATEDNATEMGGWTLNQAAEELCLLARVPAGWTAANDLTIEVQCLLLNAETANDDINMDGVWHTLTPGSGDGTGVAEEGFTAITQDIASANAQYDLHTCTLTVDHDAVGNVVAAGDMLRATISHDIAAAGTPVAGIIVIAADLVVPCFNYDA